MAAPILVTAALFAGYGVLFSYGLDGREVFSTPQTVTFAGCAEAMPIVQARIDHMGLPGATLATTEGGFSFHSQIPEALAYPVQETLAAPGVLTVLDDQDQILVTNADIDNATVFLGLRAAPRTLIQLTGDAGTRLAEAMMSHTDGSTRVMVDGEKHRHLRNLPAITNGQLELELTESTHREIIEYAAHWGVVLANGPLPCPVSVTSTSPPGN